jgi:hypothetical protein
MEITRTGEGVTLTCPNDGGRALLPDMYSLPLRIDVTAKTNEANFRLLCGTGHVSFNWERTPNKLRVQDPLFAIEYDPNNLCVGKGNIPKEEFVDITWIVNEDYMLVQVNGETRLLRTNEPYMQLKKSEYPPCFIGIATAWGSVVTVTKFEVIPWNHQDHLDTPVALTLDHPNIRMQPNATFTLHGNVIPETARNKKVIWSVDQHFVNLVDHGDGSVTIQPTDEGTATVKGYTEEGRLSDVCVVTSDRKVSLQNEVRGVAYNYFKVSDVRRSVQWYVDFLGCKIQQQSDGLAILRMPWGPDLELNKAHPDELDKVLPFGIYVENVRKYHELLQENGVKVTEIVDQGGCGLLFKVFDPDGIEIPIWGGYKGAMTDNWVVGENK